MGEGCTRNNMHYFITMILCINEVYKAPL